MEWVYKRGYRTWKEEKWMTELKNDKLDLSVLLVFSLPKS